ncbi:MAG: hypothetical protein M5R38_00315 [Candidatus Methylomirabilis sp.]|nr:hypothetical protein [Candidatus Methylomirabilis sp.]
MDAQREMVLDPHDEQVVAAAKRNGIGDDMIEAARNSPVYKFFGETCKRSYFLVTLNVHDAEHGYDCAPELPGHRFPNVGERCASLTTR